MSQQIMPPSRDAYQQNNYASRMQNVMPMMQERMAYGGGRGRNYYEDDYGGEGGYGNQINNSDI